MSFSEGKKGKSMSFSLSLAEGRRRKTHVFFRKKKTLYYV